MGFPLISVIIPMYNARKYIRRCLESVLAQVYDNLEIIVIDDGSTDDSYDICDQIKEKNSRIFLYKQLNGGVSSARNKGLQLANGDYITFVDADDYIDSEHISTMYNYMKSLRVDLMISNYYLEFDESQIKDGNNKTKVLSSKEAIINMLTNTDFDSCICCKMCSSRLAKKISFNEEYCVAEDLLFNYEIISMCDKIGYINYKSYHYVQHYDSVIHMPLTTKKIRSLKVFEDILCSNNDKDIQDAIINKYVSTCFNFLSLPLKDVTNQEVKCILSIIKRYRKRVLKSPITIPKVRVACILSYISFNLVNSILLLQKKIKRR